ncbi:hypothetical protein [Amphritea japonica]|uniref:Uncharacterized protein n=1 Tax=Amphritea japonica ATCC BAA-1530 TaxID=1278309 RepID=A0A7R6P9C5_9GAMM|nr:hypothetical protein [Amphritea japonica]BBB24966.1 conserved hypothetical protein [Amphritea japonica ATCC BAA-1530]
MRNLILFLWLLTGQVQADLHWQPSTGETKGHQGAKAHVFKLVDRLSGTNSSVELIHSDLERSVLFSGSELFRINSTGKNNYHALIAHENGNKYRRMAVRYLYLNGKPVDYSPSDLLAVGLGAFEIIPDPLPREHWRYTSGKNYSFLLKFEGELLTDQPVLVMTEFGASEILHSDATGRLEIAIPNDFPDVKPGKRANPPGELRLFSELTREGIEYQTSLSAEYRVSSESWQSVSLGSGVALGGLVFGFWLNRRLPVHSRRKTK